MLFRNEKDKINRTNNPEAYPLLPSYGSRLGNRSVKLFVTLPDIRVRFLCLLLDLLNRSFLLYDCGVNVLEQLRELDHLALDLLDGFMATLDSVEGRLSLPATVGL